MEIEKVPNLPSSVVKWVYKHANKNYWRVAAWYELDDLIQDGLMCAYKCANTYGIPGQTPTEDQIKTKSRLKTLKGDPPENSIKPAHFMSLVQMTYTNYIGDILRRSRRSLVNLETGLQLNPEMSEEDNLDRITHSEEGSQDLAVLLSEIPAYLKQVVELYINSPELIRKQSRVKLNSADETLSERLNKLIGFPKNLDFERELRNWIWERDSGLV